MLDLESFWEYTDPAASEQRFRAALAAVTGDERLELLTQIARTYGLRQRFAEAHALLNEIERQLVGAGARAHIRYSLERGRTLNSSGNKDKARLFFLQAWEYAQATQQIGLAVDAAHMVAITYRGTPDAIVWNQKALALARPAHEPKARALIPALLNNTAWDLHELGRYTEALPLFEEARAEWIARGKVTQIQIACWSVARCLRSLRRYAAALTIQRALEAEHTAAGTLDGYVYEELAENLAALGEMAEAQKYFRLAADTLGQDEWFATNEVARLARLKAHAGR